MSDTHFRPNSQADDVKQRASDAFDATSDAARETLDDLGQTARKTAERASEQMKEKVGEQQHAGADYAMRFAENVRVAAKAFEQDTPIAAHTIKMAADYVEDVAEKMRTGSLNDVMDGATSFARRQPAAFFGLSLLAGFAAVRFLKASADRGSRTHDRGDPHGSYRAGGERRSS